MFEFVDGESQIRHKHLKNEFQNVGRLSHAFEFSILPMLRWLRSFRCNQGPIEVGDEVTNSYIEALP